MVGLRLTDGENMGIIKSISPAKKAQRAVMVCRATRMGGLLHPQGCSEIGKGTSKRSFEGNAFKKRRFSFYRGKSATNTGCIREHFNDDRAEIHLFEMPLHIELYPQ